MNNIDISGNTNNSVLVFSSPGGKITQTYINTTTTPTPNNYNNSDYLISNLSLDNTVNKYEISSDTTPPVT